MKKAPLITLALLTSVALPTSPFAQPFTGPRLDTAPSTAPAGEKATKVKKPVKRQSGVKQESTAELEGEKADRRPSPKAPRDGTHPGQ